MISDNKRRSFAFSFPRNPEGSSSSFFPSNFSLIDVPPFLTVTLKTVPIMNAKTVPVRVITLNGMDMSGWGTCRNWEAGDTEKEVSTRT